MRIVSGLIILIFISAQSCATLKTKTVNYTVIKMDVGDEFYYTKRKDSLSNAYCFEHFPEIKALIYGRTEQQENMTISLNRRLTKSVAKDLARIVRSEGNYKYLVCVNKTGEVIIVKPIKYSSHIDVKTAKKAARALFETKYSEGEACLECMSYTFDISNFTGFQ